MNTVIGYRQIFIGLKICFFMKKYRIKEVIIIADRKKTILFKKYKLVHKDAWTQEQIDLILSI